MERIRVTRILRQLGLVMILPVLLVAVLALLPAMAQEPLDGGSMQEQDVRPLYDDGGPWEVGSHAAAGGSLTNHAYHEAWGVWYQLGTCGWNRRYLYNKYWAWEEDFKRAALGGKEHLFLDTVDLQFYVGHGGPGTFTFWNTAHDDKWLTPNDCYRSWGNGDNEWVALTSCQVLGGSMSQLRAWANCMYGTHLILGFQTNAAARYPYYNTQGYWFARYLCAGYTVPQAWYKAADRTQRGRIVRTLINELACLNDRPKTGWVCADSYDWDAWVQTHHAGTEPARYVDVEALNGTMPRFPFAPFALAGERYTELGGVFGVTTTVPTSVQQVDPIMWSDVSDGRELEMDSGSGLYGYTDLDNLWTYTETQQAYNLSQGLQGVKITANGARDIADRFLTDHNLMPGDAQFYEVVSDTISGGDIVSGSVAAMDASLLADEQPTVWQVSYSRILVYTPTTTLGLAQEPVEFSVVGPGAKLLVYVPTSAASASMLADNGVPVVGAIGGWREIEGQRAGSWVQSALSVDILSPTQIYTLHEQLGRVVVMDPMPIEFDDSEILSHTVGYWEEGALSSQSESIPVYELTVRYTLGISEVAVIEEHIAANETYMPPFAEIESAPTEMVQVGQTVNFTATDATRTLADLGYDPSLDFVLGKGPPYDFLYEWYVNSVAEANRIAVGRSIDFPVPADVTERAGSVQQTIILKVTDITNPDQPSTTDSTTLDVYPVYPRIFLPVILRNY